MTDVRLQSAGGGMTPSAAGSVSAGWAGGNRLPNSSHGRIGSGYFFMYQASNCWSVAGGSPAAARLASSSLRASAKWFL